MKMKLIEIKKKIVTIIFTLMILINLSIYLNNFSTNYKTKCKKYPHGTQLEINSELPVDIYTFFAPNDNLILKNLSLEGGYIYYIFGELITPYNISRMRIRIYDPDNCWYDIFENQMSIESKSDCTFKIPFGTVSSGNYTIEFNIECLNNVNIFIKIEKGAKCLYDKLDYQDIDNIAFFNVVRFHNNQYIEQKFQLDENTMYKFYYGRVSSIALFNYTDIWVDINLTDSVGVEFEICSNELLNNINELNGFNFGTANQGFYTLKIKLYCQVNYVNMAFAVVNGYKIIGKEDLNQTNPIPTNSSETPNITYYIPREYIIGTIVFMGILCGVPIIVVIYHKKKNTNF